MAEQHGYYTKKAAEILELVEKDGDTTTEHQNSRNFMIENVVGQIKGNNEDVKKIDSEIRNIMKNIDCKFAKCG